MGMGRDYRNKEAQQARERARLEQIRRDQEQKRISEAQAVRDYENRQRRLAREGKWKSK